MKTLLKGAIGLSLLASSVLATEPTFSYDSQIRAGYISLDNKGSITDPDQKSIAIGGHIGIKTNYINGISLGAEIYTVQDMGIQEDDPNEINGDFFNSDLEGFSLLSQAYISAKWGNTQLKIGRQLIDTPHADSDDIRMIPNYFTAYLLSNTDIEGLTLTVGSVTHMAGWENGIDAGKFKRISDILGTSEKTDGIYLASAVYEGIENLSLQGWFYNLDEIANIVYLEAGYETKIQDISLTLGAQADIANDTGDALLGNIDSKAYGISLEMGFENGLGIALAYNWSEDDGAFGSFGGGAFFTSLEDQTLDAIGEKGDAWIVSLNQDFSDLGVKGLSLGATYGEFKADDTQNYEVSEIDLIADYSINDNLLLTVAYADVNDKTGSNEDYSQIRIIANYNF